ncbi:MAG: hypothetical protein AAFM92_11205 [Pseudomonadota bacterium]
MGKKHQRSDDIALAMAGLPGWAARLAEGNVFDPAAPRLTLCPNGFAQSITPSAPPEEPSQPELV